MSEISNAIRHLCEEKGLSYEVVLETLETALGAAYRKDFGSKNQNIKVQFNPDTGSSAVFDVKTVVEDMPVVEEIEESEDESKDKEVPEKKEESEEEGEEERRFNPKTEIELKDAILIQKNAKIGDEIKIELDPPSDYGRMAAQTAKQVIIQKLREAERNMILEEFKDKEGEVLSGVVQRSDGRIVLIDLGKAVGILPREEQIYSESYRPGNRIKVYVKEVREGRKGPEIILSRTSEEILKKIFFTEIPEISNGLIELKSVAREAGARSKAAVLATAENIDPIGSCVGQRGARIQTIISELGGEKVDIIEYNEDPTKFITNALSPAKITSIEIDEENKKALVTVALDQQSLAIGKGGQNVRLAARLTGWSVDIVGDEASSRSDDDDDDKKDDEEDESQEEAGEEKEEEAQESEETKEVEDKK